MRRLAAAGLVALLSPACVALRPFAEVAGGLPAERFVRVGDQRVYVEQAGAGVPVVLLHGFGASSYSWRRVIPELAAEYRTVAIDLNGFGWTERPRSAASYTRDGQLALVLGVMDELGIERAHLVGSSYGGALGLWLAAAQPQRLRSLVLVDSAAPSYLDERRSALVRLRPLARLFLRGYALRPRNVRASLRASFYDDSQVTPELVSAYLERLQVEGIDDAYIGLVAPRRAKLPAFDYRRVNTPALVVWGAEDELISASWARRTVARLPDSEFVTLAATGHLPMEERPRELLALVLPFLARH
jgi:pimeloyl-ACP methyl ester carboxylesterase